VNVFSLFREMFCFPLCGRGKECRLPLPTVDECGRPGNCNRPDFREREEHHIGKLLDLEALGELDLVPADWQDWEAVYATARKIFPRDEYRQTDLVSRTFLRCYRTRRTLCSIERLYATLHQLARRKTTPKENTNKDLTELGNGKKPEPTETAGHRQHIARRNADYLSNLKSIKG